MKLRLTAINIDPELMGGTPVFSGTRVPVKHLFDWLKDSTLNDFLEKHNDIDPDAALRVLAYVASRLPEEQTELEEELTNFRKDALSNVINIDPEIVSGTPVFRGTRVPIKNLFDWLEDNDLEDFLDNFPTVQKEQAIEILRASTEALLKVKN